MPFKNKAPKKVLRDNKKTLNKMVHIYVLKLRNGKYYVGKTDDVQKRFVEHLHGNGSAWTKKYLPIKIEKIINNASPFDEDKITKEYMSIHGIDNVRGGIYVNIKLDEFQSETLKQEIWGASDACTRCGRKGHFIKNCYANTDVYGESLNVWVCDNCDEEFDNEDDCDNHRCKKVLACYRCGRTNHLSPNCYASRHINGKSI